MPLTTAIAPLLAGLALSLSSSSVLAQEEIYLVRGLIIDVVDPATGMTKWSMPQAVGTNINGMTYDGARLLGVDLNGFLPADVIEVHPASGLKKKLGTTGLSWHLAGLAYDWTSGKTYATHGDQLFLVDPVDPPSGSVTLLGSFSGLVPFEQLSGLAINRSGEAYALGYQDTTLYKLDLTSLSATALGRVSPGPPWNFYSDAAFDSSGVLWAVWRGLPRGGVYKIDVQSLTVELAFSHVIFNGIAIGPATPETQYCAGKTNSLGCDPILESSGLASETGASGYEVGVSNVRNNTLGRLLYTTAGAASNPFAGGTLCVASPWKETPIVSSGGSAQPAHDCTGSWTYDLNAHFTANPGPGAGDTVYCQWVGRDRGFAPPENYALSSALEFTLLP